MSMPPAGAAVDPIDGTGAGAFGLPDDLDPARSGSEGRLMYSASMISPAGRRVPHYRAGRS
jgi:hypothetical protein